MPTHCFTQWTDAEKGQLWQLMCEAKSNREIAALMPGRTIKTISTMKTLLRHEKNGTTPRQARQSYDSRYGEAAVKQSSQAFAAAFARSPAA